MVDWDTTRDPRFLAFHLRNVGGMRPYPHYVTPWAAWADRCMSWVGIGPPNHVGGGMAVRRRFIRAGAAAAVGILVGGVVLEAAPQAATSYPAPLVSVAIGRYPRALTVDAGTGHLFVISEGAANGPGVVSMLEGPPDGCCTWPRSGHTPPPST